MNERQILVIPDETPHVPGTAPKFAVMEFPFSIAKALMDACKEIAETDAALLVTTIVRIGWDSRYLR